MASDSDGQVLMVVRRDENKVSLVVFILALWFGASSRNVDARIGFKIGETAEVECDEKPAPQNRSSIQIILLVI